jgi:hypothetical protein
VSAPGLTIGGRRCKPPPKIPGSAADPEPFSIPYAQLKSPEAEMARLTHNDYLEQFSDSGVVPAALAYTAWIFMALWVIAKKLWRTPGISFSPSYAGLLAWFAQGLGEFSLYIPALAWIWLLRYWEAWPGRIIEFDNKTPMARIGRQ